MKHLDLIAAGRGNKSILIDMTCFSGGQTPRSTPQCQTGAMNDNDMIRRCEDKESGEEQKVNVANQEACMCQEKRE